MLGRKRVFCQQFLSSALYDNEAAETPLTNLAQPQLCLWVVPGVAPTSGLHLAFSR